MSNDDALYAVIAKNRAGRERLEAGWRQVVPTTFPAADAGWWIDADAGLAVHAARMAVAKGAGTSSVVALAGDGALSASPDAAAGADDLLRRLRHSGAGLLRECTGEFALAFWDGERRSLHLVRDHFGQRSVFLRDDGDLVVVCSDMEPLLSDPAFNTQLDLESAQHFLCFGLPLPGRTLARRITTVPAGQALMWTPGQPMLLERYYTPLGFEHQKVVDDSYRAQIAETLDEAIRTRDGGGRSAMLLSGGVDSSYIAATCAMTHGGEGYDAYTVQFVDGAIENEVPYAEMVAGAAGIRLHVVPMDVTDARTALGHVLGLAQPCSAWAALTHHHLLGRIRADGHVRLLSGLGADEVFGGYSKYLHHYRVQRAHAEQWETFGVDAFDGLLRHPTLAGGRLFSGVPRFFDDAAQRRGFHKPFDAWSHLPVLTEFYRECRRQKPDAHLFELMVAHECQHRVPDLLMAGFEPIARAAGVTTAYPFLDPKVAAMACALGAGERFWLAGGRWKNKKVLRRIALERLPPDIIARKPASYTTPIHAWLAQPAFRSETFERLRASGFWDQCLVRLDWLDGIEAAVCARSASRRAQRGLHFEQLWILIVLSAWCDRWVTGQFRRHGVHP